MGFWECRRSKEHQKLHRLVNFQIPIKIFNAILAKNSFFRALQHRIEAGLEWDPKGSGDGAVGWPGGLGSKNQKIREKVKIFDFSEKS